MDNSFDHMTNDEKLKVLHDYDMAMQNHEQFENPDFMFPQANLMQRWWQKIWPFNRAIKAKRKCRMNNKDYFNELKSQTKAINDKLDLMNTNLENAKYELQSAFVRTGGSFEQQVNEANHIGSVAKDCFHSNPYLGVAGTDHLSGGMVEFILSGYGNHKACRIDAVRIPSEDKFAVQTSQSEIMINQVMTNVLFDSGMKFEYHKTRLLPCFIAPDSYLNVKVLGYHTKPLTLKKYMVQGMLELHNWSKLTQKDLDIMAGCRSIAPSLEDKGYTENTK